MGSLTTLTKMIQLNLTQEQFNLVWNLLNEDLLSSLIYEENDVKVWLEVLDIMEDKINQ